MESKKVPEAVHRPVRVERESAGKYPPLGRVLKQVSTKYQHDWGKAYWEVAPKDVVDIGGSQFVKLSRAGCNSGFARLCIETEDHKIPRDLRLQQSVAYDRIVMDRNAAQEQHFRDAVVASVPAVFQCSTSSVDVEDKHMLAIQRSKKRELKQHPSVMELTIQEVGEFAERTIRVKRPLNEREWLVVEHDTQVIAHIVALIRRDGFDSDIGAKPSGLPTGIYYTQGYKGVKHPFQYLYMDEHTGKKSRHFATSLEGAIEGRMHGPPPDAEGVEGEAVEGGDDGDDVGMIGDGSEV